MPGAGFLNMDLSGNVNATMIWERNITSGSGRSYGLELLAHRKSGRLQGWIGYTLSWIKYRFELINHGRPFYPKYDRRHDISIVATYDYSDKIKLSGTWVYGSGGYIDAPVAGYSLKSYAKIGPNSKHFDALSEKNTFRMSAYHRLDLAAQFYNYKRRTTRIWEVGVYNAYNHLNPYYYQEGWDDDRHVRVINKVGMFPILPSISWTIKF